MVPSEKRLVVHIDGKVIVLDMQTLKPTLENKVIKVQLHAAPPCVPLRATAACHRTAARTLCPSRPPHCCTHAAPRAAPHSALSSRGCPCSLAQGITLIKKDCRQDGASGAFSLVKRRGVHQMRFYNGILQPDKEYRDVDGDFKDTVALARDGKAICVGRKKKYSVVNLDTLEHTELFPYEDQTIALVQRVGSREFLLSVWTEGLTTGMFVTASGNISRPPIQWPFRPSCIACNYPYVVALSEEQGLVTVHSILDQQSKQVIPYEAGTVLNDTSGRIFIATKNKISLIVPLSFETQIDELLEAGRVQEALTLAQVSFGSPNQDLDAEEFERQRKIMLAIQRRAGLTYLRSCDFSEGLDLLAATNIDPREIIHLYPGLLPKSTKYTPAAGADGIGSILSVAKTEADVAKAKTALIQFLKIIKSDAPREWAADIDTALAHLYAEFEEESLLELVTGDNACEVDDLADALNQHKRVHALALLYAQSNAPRRALEIWKRLHSTGADAYVDPTYPGLDHVIRVLCATADIDLVYLHAEWMLDADQKAVRVFTRRPDGEPKDAFNPDNVLEFLRKYGEAMFEYLEYLVFDVETTVEKHHTRLAYLYLNKVKTAKLKAESTRQVLGEADESSLDMFRAKFRSLLHASSYYRVESLLEQVKMAGLHQETAILYGKLGQHDKALHLLVNELKDHEGAQQYCVENSKGDREGRQGLFLLLLKVYLVRGSGFSQQAIDMMNNSATDLDVTKVMDLVPPEWSVAVMNSFLRRSIRRSMHDGRMRRIKHGLARQDKINVSQEHIRRTDRWVGISEDTRCDQCRRNLTAAYVSIDAGKQMILCKRCTKENARKMEARAALRTKRQLANETASSLA